jgi:hypothetical protein
MQARMKAQTRSAGYRDGCRPPSDSLISQAVFDQELSLKRIPKTGHP